MHKIILAIAMLAASVAANGVIDTPGGRAWAVCCAEWEQAWADYLTATASALAAYDTATDKAKALSVYKAFIEPHKEAYFARIDAARAVYEAALLAEME